ncbi:hypothetical protein ACLOJK_041885 [Asimina triloba]
MAKTEEPPALSSLHPSCDESLNFSVALPEFLGYNLKGIRVNENDNDGDSINGNDDDLTPCPKNPSINDIDRKLTRLTAAVAATIGRQEVGQRSGSGEVCLHRPDPGGGWDEQVLRHADETRLCGLELDSRRKLSELFRVLPVQARPSFPLPSALIFSSPFFVRCSTGLFCEALDDATSRGLRAKFLSAEPTLATDDQDLTGGHPTIETSGLGRRYGAGREIKKHAFIQPLMQKRSRNKD